MICDASYSDDQERYCYLLEYSTALPECVL